MHVITNRQTNTHTHTHTHKFHRQLEKRRDKKWYKFKTRTNNGVQNETELIERLTKNNNRIKVSSSESVNKSNVKETESNTLTSSSPNDRDLDGNETTKEDSETRHIDNKFITDNQKSRKKFKQETFIDKGNANSINNVMIENSTQSNERIRSYTEAVKYSTSDMSETFNKNNLSEIYKQLIEDENKNSLKIETAPPKVCINSATSSNASDSIFFEDNPTVFSSQDEEII